jgi:hypothetical protein
VSSVFVLLPHAASTRPNHVQWKSLLDNPYKKCRTWTLSPFDRLAKTAAQKGSKQRKS